MRHGFVRLDPDKCVPLPKFMSSEFFTIAYRARRLLANRSRDAIEAFAKMLIQMHRAPGFEDPIYSILENWDPMDFDGPNGVQGIVPRPSDVGELLHNVNRIDLKKIENPLKAAWHELFGTLALSYVDKATWLEAEHSTGAPPSFRAPFGPQALAKQITEYALYGMEAVAMGEALLRQNKVREAQIDRAWAERNKAQAPKGGKARGRRSRELLAAFLRFAEGRKFRSDLQAVTQFLEQCDKSSLRGFAPSNVKRMLYEKVREHRKGLLS